MNDPENDPPRPAHGPGPASAETPSHVAQDTDPTSPAAFGITPAADAAAFAPSEVVATRFRIVRLLGQGGMGQVYAAEDLEVQDAVAVKIIRPEIAADERAMERFRREIHLARKVTHPNVCRVFDVFRHHTAKGREIALISMELLEGETLAARLKRRGRMPPAEALPIVRQVAAALGAAHRAGVVHRDLKPGNVILTGTDGARVVVTDFGLARRSAEDRDPVDDPTGAGVAVGTAGYMAPEQVEGLEATAAADIYALGVVVFQMVTGRLPFEGGSSLSIAVRRLKSPPPAPSSLAPGIDPAWEAAILRCLARDPRDRFPSAEDLVLALESGRVTRGARRGRLRIWRAAAVIVPFTVLLGALGVNLFRSREGTGSARAPAAPVRRSVALLGFKNLSGRADAAWLSVALSEMLRTELAAGERLRAISGEDVARMKVDLALGEADSLARDTLARVRANLGSDLVVLGSYLAMGDRAGGQLRLDLRVQDAEAGETIATVSEVGTEQELIDLVSRTGRVLRDRLGAGQAAAPDAAALRAALPAHPEARRTYAEGLARLRLFDARAAIAHLQAATAAEPDHPLPHSALAEAWTALGYETRAAEQARRAFALSSSLPREQRLWVEGRHREAAREWDEAVEIYRMLWSFFPDNLEYGLRLSATQRSAGRGADALAVADALRAAPGGADDPRVDLAEASAAESVSDYRRQQRAAEAAARKGTTRGARLLVARARVLEGEAFQNLGETTRAAAAYEEARSIFEQSGDRAGLALATSRQGIVLWFQGRLPESRQRLEEALRVSREIGDTRGEARTRLNIGNTFLEQGDSAKALEAYEASLATFRELGDRQNTARALNNIASSLQLLGRLGAARQRYEESLAIKREIGDAAGAAMTTTSIGTVHQLEGDPEAAFARFEEARAALARLGNRHGEAVAPHGIGEARAAQGAADEARRAYEQALRERTALGENVNAAETRLALARLDLEAGRYEAARGPALAAAEVFRASAAHDKELVARLVAASGHLAGAPAVKVPPAAIAAAREEVGRARALAGARPSPRLHVLLSIAGARIEAASGQAAAAAEMLRSAASSARQAGLVPDALEAELWLAAVESAGARQKRLQAVRAEAGRRGLRALERRAAAARP